MQLFSYLFVNTITEKLMDDNWDIVGTVQSSDTETSVLRHLLLVPMGDKACKHLQLYPSTTFLAYVLQLQFQWALK